MINSFLKFKNGLVFVFEPQKISFSVCTATAQLHRGQKYLFNSISMSLDWVSRDQCE